MKQGWKSYANFMRGTINKFGWKARDALTASSAWKKAKATKRVA